MYIDDCWSEFLETTWKRRESNTSETIYIASLMFVLSENRKIVYFVEYAIFGNKTRILGYRPNEWILLSVYFLFREGVHDVGSYSNIEWVRI